MEEVDMAKKKVRKISLSPLAQLGAALIMADLMRPFIEKLVEDSEKEKKLEKIRKIVCKDANAAKGTWKK